MKQTILVTGGSGYIGSHTVLELIKHNYHVIVVDKECSTQLQSPHVSYFQCDIADVAVIKTICTHYHVRTVIHCAASIQVGASTTDPEHYYDNNVTKTLTFLKTIRACGIDRIIFSSSAAVYGIPQTLPLKEEHPCEPISPYGRSKLMIEQVLRDYYTAYGFKSISLRYFNAAGAYAEYGLGEHHKPETHLIPCIIHAMLEQRPFTLFGTTYTTHDGTCVRDYVHVRDIARAHRHAVEWLEDYAGAECINIGSGTGLSIRDIINTVRTVTQKPCAVLDAPRRPGDPDYLIADISKAGTLLGWQPEHSDKETIVLSAYEAIIRHTLPHNKPPRTVLIQTLL